ncbi:MAG: uracil-DNA glycosylase [Cyanobacteria bacterium P01_D01_bin.123]
MTEDFQPSLFSLLDGVAVEPQPPVEVDFDRIPQSADVLIPTGTYASLTQLTQHCHVCQRCELHVGRTNAVVERGNPDAGLMIIGEGPGQNEDEAGLPFVGKSGQLLDKILQSVKFDPQKDVYICNVVKCRPPGNRTPTPAEMSACQPYLLEQIRLNDPKIILLTGATAVRAILNEKRGITKLQGQWFEWQQRWTMPIFHPAYLLRNPSRDRGKPKWLMWQDIQAVRAKYEELIAVS